MIAPTANIDLSGLLVSPAGLLLRAVETRCFGLTLADARQPDCPLVFANRAFERMTGFEISEILGLPKPFSRTDLLQTVDQLVGPAAA